MVNIMIDIEKVKSMSVEEIRSMSSREISEITNADKERVPCPGQAGFMVPKNCTLFCKACNIKAYGLYNGYYID